MGPLDVDDLVRVFVAVVLIGDVDVGPGLDVAADVDLEMADDVTAPADHAAVTDPYDGVSDHRLPRHHAGRQTHEGADQRVPTDADPLFAEDGPGRKGQAAPPPEGAEPVRQAVAGSGGPVADYPVPSGMNDRVEHPMAQSAHVTRR